MVFEREKTEKTNGDRWLARTEKSLLYALSIRAATERNLNGYYPFGGSNPSPSATVFDLENRTRTLSNSHTVTLAHWLDRPKCCACNSGQVGECCESIKRVCFSTYTFGLFRSVSRILSKMRSSSSTSANAGPIQATLG